MADKSDPNYKKGGISSASIKRAVSVDSSRASSSQYQQQSIDLETNQSRSPVRTR